MTSPRALLFDGTDIETLCIVRDFSGLKAPGLRKGPVGIDVPNRAGVIGVPGLPYAEYAFSIPIFLDGDTEEEYEASYDAISAVLLGPSGDGLGSLERHMPKTGGYWADTANGRFVADTSYTLFNGTAGTSELQFVNLDGAWLRGTDWVR